MKTNLLKFTGKPGLYVGLALCGLFFVNCSSDDDNTPEDFDFEEEFQDIGELPDVEDEDPEITEPDTGAIEESAKTTAVIADLGDGSGDVSAETQASLDAVESFGADLSADTQAEASTLDATRAEEILNMESFDGDLAEVAASLEDAPAEILELLPTIDFGADLAATAVFNADFTKSGLGINDAQSQAQQSGPCFDAAQEAYDEAMAPAIAKRDDNLAIIDANYQRRLSATEDRAGARQTAVDEAYNAYLSSMLTAVTSLLNYADAIQNDAPALASNIRTYALIYLVGASNNLTVWYNAATQKVEDKEAAEKQTIEDIRDAKTAEVETNFAAIKAEADAKLTAAFSNCHNQGSGS